MKKLLPVLIAILPALVIGCFLLLFLRSAIRYPVDSDDLIFVNELRAKGFWSAFYYFYSQVNGRWFSHLYTCSVFYLLQDQIQYYWIYLLTLLSFFIFSFSCFLKAAALRCYRWSLDPRQALGSALLLTSCLYFFLYEGRWEVWFWVCSTGVHLISICLLFLGFATLWNRQPPRLFTYILLIVLFAAVGGLDEENAVLAGMFLIAEGLVLISRKKQKAIGKVALAGTVLLISLLVNLVSSGFRERLAWEPSNNFMGAVSNTLRTAIIPIREYTLLPLKILVMVALATGLFRLSQKFPAPATANFRRQFILKGVLVTGAVVFSFFIPCYTLSIIAPPRCLVLGYGMVLLFLSDQVIRWYAGSRRM